MKKSKVYVGLDVHKDTIAVAIADDNRNGEVRFYGNIYNTAQAIGALMMRLSKTHEILQLAYEAGPTGYSVYRQLKELGFECVVVAPSRIPKDSSNRIKNDHRDSKCLARLLRAGELESIWIPDEIHEAIRDLVRSRQAASRDMRIAKTRIKSFLLKYNKLYSCKSWTQKHRLWLANLQFDNRAQQIALQSYLNSLDHIEGRREEIDRELREITPDWKLYPEVVNIQALRGIGFTVAVTIMAEVGDIGRFGHPKNLMAFLGLVPGEHSSGSSTNKKGITKCGNSDVRYMLYEAAWNYRNTPKVGAWMLKHRPEGISQDIQDIAWKAQLRLHKRYRALLHRGKKTQVAVTAVTRELIGFIWDIGTRARANES